MKKILLLLLFVGSGTFHFLNAQHIAEESDNIDIGNYERAENMLSWNLEDRVYNSNVSPVWLDGQRFWYSTITRDGMAYYLVDASEQTKRSLFDTDQLKQALGYQKELLEVEITGYNPADDQIKLSCQNELWLCDLNGQYTCEKLEEKQYSENEILSPDKKWLAFRKDWNLWVKDIETNKTIQLTEEGYENYGYATHNDGWRHTQKPVISWSPDSRKIATYRLDERGVKETVLWETAEKHPIAHTWPLALPGDSAVPMMERVIIDLNSGEITELQTSQDHQRYSNCCGSMRGDRWADVRWSADGNQLAFVSVSRDYKEATLKLADATTGTVTEILHERDEFFFESNLVYMQDPNWHYLFDSDEVIWFSRRSNWGHLYLYDGETGEIKNQITSGDWNVINIKHIDEENRKIYFTAVGREDGQDPYQHNFYSVNFDGSGLKLLTEEQFDHSIFLSPDAHYFVDLYSDFQTPDIALLKNINGETIMDLEKADISELEKLDWRAPEPFTVKARDGETDIYGIMLLPSNFDPDSTYPIINRIYPGPQVGSIRTRSFSAGRNGEAQALAELGFVVVLIDGLGSPFRSKEFHTAWYGKMQDNGLPDQISGMKQLAERHDFIDIDRVGMYGHSGGGYATASALLQYPEFFNVGVSSAGNHDNAGYTYYWGEKYQGLLQKVDGTDNYESQANQNYAENLEGKLLITYGTMDDNVHPNMTMLLVDELIRHNKDFDLMAFPNRNHGYSTEPYHVRRTWDYFVEHLMGKMPPKEFLIERE